jgi:ketosteroid isomerase-like protein
VQRPDGMQEQNLALVREFCEARAKEDTGAMMGCLAEDVVWRYPGRNALSREYRGKEEVAGFFRGLRELTGGEFTSEAERIMVDETVAFVHELPRGTRKGKPLGWRTVLMLRLRDGKISEVDVFQNVQHELDEWWDS